MRMTLGAYLPGSSPVHLLDPRVKLFLMAFGIGAAFRMDTPASLGLFSAACLLATLAARLPLRRILRGLSPFLWLFGITAALHVFMTPGSPIPWVPHATWEGLANGVRTGLQLVFAIWLSTLMTLTTSPLDMVWAMEWYLKPLKHLRVPVDEIALLVMLAIRFIPVLFEETDRILKAQKARGVDIETGGIVRRIRSLVPVMVPLLHSVFRRSDDLAVALTLRGYSPGIKRTRMKTPHARRSDIASLAAASAVLVALILM
ncbi:MAG: energy-coupling factor transporter transmembrane component T [Desulfomonilia bacterium]|jgi:energy-coupling factor transport system permease protein